MSQNREICKVISSDIQSRKIVVEVNGKIIKTEKVIGLDFRPGDYACYQTFDGTKRSLVVALSPDEAEKASKLKFQELADQKLAEPEKDNLEFLEPKEGYVPLDEEVFNLQFEKERTKSFLDPDRINDQEIMSRIKMMFSHELSIEEETESIKDIFPVIAVQTDENFKEIKAQVYKRADTVLLRKLVQDQNNRDVLSYLRDMIDRIKKADDHEKFFNSLGFYLSRLREIQKEKKWGADKMGVLFYPIYKHYVQRFNRAAIDQWIKSNTFAVS